MNFTSIAIDLEARASAKHKAKKWANECGGTTISRLAITTENHPVFASRHPNRSPSSYLWGNGSRPLTPFWQFYTVKYPLQVAALLKYCEGVRNIANKSGNWRYHDQQFRYLRQTNPEKFLRDRVRWEVDSITTVLCAAIHSATQCHAKPSHAKPSARHAPSTGEDRKGSASLKLRPNSS